MGEQADSVLMWSTEVTQGDLVQELPNWEASETSDRLQGVRL